MFDKFFVSSGIRRVQQYYIDKHVQKHLTNDQRKSLSDYCDAHKYPELIFISMGSTPENEIARYAREMFHELKKCYPNLAFVTGGTQDPGETGIMVELTDPDNPSKYAKELMELLKQSNLPFRTEKYSDPPNVPIVDFATWITSDVPVPY